MRARQTLPRIIAAVTVLLIVAASLCALDGNDPQRDLCLLLVMMTAVFVVPLRLPAGGHAIASLVWLHPPLVPSPHTPAPI